MSLIRLDKYISERTEYTRSQIKVLALKGNISVDGNIVKKSDLKIDDVSADVRINGKPVSAQKYKYILMNKPEGYICSTDDHDGETVMKLIPPEMRAKGLFPAGRLDKDSLGALLITNDGELAHRMLSPASHVPKIYIVKLDRPFESKYIDVFKKGLKLSNGEQFMPADVKIVENSDRLAFIRLHEGKFHQVKRMFEAVENHVQILMRVSLGGLVLPEKLAKGQCIELLHKDVENLTADLDFEDFYARFSAYFSAFVINI